MHRDDGVTRKREWTNMMTNGEQRYLITLSGTRKKTKILSYGRYLARNRETRIARGTTCKATGSETTDNSAAADRLNLTSEIPITDYRVRPTTRRRLRRWRRVTTANDKRRRPIKHARVPSKPRFG